MSDVAAEEKLQKYLDPAVLSQIRGLDLRTRLVVEGFITGLHRSPFLGLSVEFAQHREYAPGDDIKHIDWKVYSRSDRYFIKQYEEETNLCATFVVDVSESMKYAGRAAKGLTKFHYACCLAASLAHLLQRQQDAVGLATFDEDVRDVLPPSGHPQQLKTIVHTLEEASRSLKAKTSLEPVCQKVAHKLTNRGLVCLLSDLFVEEDGLMRGLRLLTHRGHDVMVLHVLDQDELTFPFDGNILFRGMEAMGEALAQPRALREGYLEAINRFNADVQRRCVSNRIQYKLVNTGQNLGVALSEFLAARHETGRRGNIRRPT
jgi:uncharacterized protein (DUF58 family)